MRRFAGIAVAVVIGLAAVAGLLVFLSSRDRSQVSARPRGPGQAFPDQGMAVLRPGQRPPRPYASDPPTSGPHARVPVTRDAARLSDAQVLTALAAGNVILFYGTASPPAPLRALANDEAGSFDAPLARTGQAVVLAARPGTPGVVAAAWRHLLRTPSPTDPALRQFVEAWLGVGARGK